MRERFANPIECLDPDLSDGRLEELAEKLDAWVVEDVLTLGVRRSGPAPTLHGTVRERLRPAGDDRWAIGLRVPNLSRACIEYMLVEEGRVIDPGGVWRGPLGAPEAMATAVSAGPSVVIDSAHVKVAETHPVRFWAPDDPEVLMLCADGDGLQAWASVIAAAGLPVALVGVVSAGLQVRDNGEPYDARLDPRARAYLHDVDPVYFGAHMSYVLDSVLPWACAKAGNLPTYVFGVSNGAAFAASAAADHADRFAGALPFSLGVLPRHTATSKRVPHALVAGRLEPGFLDATSRYARRLRRRGIPTRLIRPVRGHDHSMWRDELVPALSWILAI